MALLLWVLFRNMFGAGMIKVRGDDCWRDLTCLNTHFETQPLPNLLSPWFHQLPQWMLKAACYLTMWWNCLPHLGCANSTLPHCCRYFNRHISNHINYLWQLIVVKLVNIGAMHSMFRRSHLATHDSSTMATHNPNRYGVFGAGHRHPVGTNWLGCLVAVLSIQPIQNLLQPTTHEHIL